VKASLLSEGLMHCCCNYDLGYNDFAFVHYSEMDKIDDFGIRIEF